MRPSGVALRLAALSLIAATGSVADSHRIEVGAFSREAVGDGAPSGWEPLTFARDVPHTEYSLVADAGTVVVRAESRGGASGLTRSVEIDPHEFPVVEWRWRIANVLEGADVSRKEGDDYPARLYVTFAYEPESAGLLERVRFETLRLLYGEYPPRRALNYIWASRAPIGASVPNPYTSRNQMIVVESGAEKVGRWVAAQRNVANDYESAFAEPAPRISGVAIMTDTDDTGEAAVAWFGDIVFRSDRADELTGD